MNRRVMDKMSEGYDGLICSKGWGDVLLGWLRVKNEGISMVLTIQAQTYIIRDIHNNW